VRARALAVVALAGCVAPTQGGGVEVREGAAERLAVVCRWRRGDNGRDGCANADAKPAARVARIEGQAGALKGALAIGKSGDWALENDEIRVVVDALGPGVGFAESGGNVVDAADVRARVDELGQMFTYFGVFPRQAVYEHLATKVLGDGTAVVDVTGHELYEPTLAVSTRYALAPGSRALEITTELENKGPRPLDPIDLGDAIQWGGAEKIAPGAPAGFAGAYAGPFVAGVGRAVAYALVPIPCAPGECATGDAPAIVSKSGTAWTNATYAQKIALSPGQKARYKRALVVAQRGDTVAVESELAYLGGASPGGLAVDLVDAQGAAVAPVASRVVLTPAVDPSAPATLAPLYVRAVGGELAAELAPGVYTARFEGDGRAASAEAKVTIVAGAVTKARLVVSQPSRLRVVVTEDGGAIPAKIQLFDAATGALAAPPENAPHGRAEIAAAPGRYRVVASRGPAYDLAEATLAVDEGATADVPLALRRVVDTSGFVACDLHQHTAWSFDSGVTVQERVVANAVEGVACAVASEHNHVVDFAPAIEALGLAPFFKSFAGDELTSDASRAPWGHANVFPLVADPSKPRGGALVVRDRPVRELFAAARALSADGGSLRPILQINHPRAPNRIGYFEQFGVDASGAHEAGYDPDFDALEVWSGRHAAARDRVLQDLWAMLAAGHPVTPTANTDTHGVVGQEAGYPRTWIRVADEDPAKLTAAALVEGLRDERDVVLSNGPFITLRGASVREGGRATVGASGLDLTAHVERAAWVDVTEIVVVAGGVAGEGVPVGCGLGCAEAHTTRRGATSYDIRVHVVRRASARAPRVVRHGTRVEVELAADSFVAVVARGARPLEPVLHGDPAEMLPFAITAPLWLDVDGDGAALGR
jgi:hypothetical protein